MNVDLNHFSRIGHTFYDVYSNTQCICCNVLDGGTNMSDHCAVLSEVKLNFVAGITLILETFSMQVRTNTTVW